jgi:hypothetical protein
VIDPSGQFGLASLGSTLNILGNLMTMATTVHSVFQIASGEKEFSAKEVGTEIILGMLGNGAGKILGLMSKKSRDILQKTFDYTGCFFNSFSAGTLVHTSRGVIPIEQVEIGDKVLAFDEETQELSYEEVSHLIQNETSYNFVIIQLDSGEVIEATPEHPFYVSSDWKQANELAIGDELLSSKGNASVTNITRDVRSEKVYNLTVDRLHTYFISSDGVLVHNQNKNTGCKFRGRKAKGFDWDHIFDRHSVSGGTARQRTRLEGNTVFPANLTNKQIKARVMGAWKNRELRRTRKDPVTGNTQMFYEGIDGKSGQKVGFWFNAKTQVVESAFPR